MSIEAFYSIFQEINGVDMNEQEIKKVVRERYARSQSRKVRAAQPGAVEPPSLWISARESAILERKCRLCQQAQTWWKADGLG